MFDQKALKEGKARVNPVRTSGELTLSGLTIHELLAKRAEIETYLPSAALVDMDLEGELLMQYHQTKALLSAVIEDDQTPANQKAQIINSCSAILTQITRTQTDLYNGERLKVMEQAVINALKSVPDEVSEKFFENYERELARMALK